MDSRTPNYLSGINQEELIKQLTMPSNEISVLHGAEVNHGTIGQHLESVLEGPKNLGRGFGGPGLYLDLNDSSLAWEYALMAREKIPSSEAIILTGNLHLENKPLRVAQFEVQRNPTSITYSHEAKRIILPADWARDVNFQKFMIENFDILAVVVKPASNLAIEPKHGKFLVLHEGAKDSIEWKSWCKPTSTKGKGMVPSFPITRPAPNIFEHLDITEEDVLKKITMTAKEMKDEGLINTDLFHGTGKENIESLQRGIDNRGVGIAGRGTYFGINDKEIAIHYSSKPEFHESVAMRAKLKFQAGSQRIRIARITMSSFPFEGIKLNSNGTVVFGVLWSKSKDLQAFMHKHFDAILVTNVDINWVISNGRFLTIHQTGGAFLTWEDYHLVKNGKLDPGAIPLSTPQNALFIEILDPEYKNKLFPVGSGSIHGTPEQVDLVKQALQAIPNYNKDFIPLSRTIEQDLQDGKLKIFIDPNSGSGDPAIWHPKKQISCQQKTSYHSIIILNEKYFLDKSIKDYAQVIIHECTHYYLHKICGKANIFLGMDLQAKPILKQLYTAYLKDISLLFPDNTNTSILTLGDNLPYEELFSMPRIYFNEAIQDALLPYLGPIDSNKWDKILHELELSNYEKKGLVSSLQTILRSYQYEVSRIDLTRICYDALNLALAEIPAYYNEFMLQHPNSVNPLPNTVSLINQVLDDKKANSSFPGSANPTYLTAGNRPTIKFSDETPAAIFKRTFVRTPNTYPHSANSLPHIPSSSWPLPSNTEIKATSNKIPLPSYSGASRDHTLKAHAFVSKSAAAHSSPPKVSIPRAALNTPKSPFRKLPDTPNVPSIKPSTPDNRTIPAPQQTPKSDSKPLLPVAGRRATSKFHLPNKGLALPYTPSISGAPAISGTFINANQASRAGEAIEVEATIWTLADELDYVAKHGEALDIKERTPTSKIKSGLKIAGRTIQAGLIAKELVDNFHETGNAPLSMVRTTTKNAVMTGVASVIGGPATLGMALASMLPLADTKKVERELETAVEKFDKNPNLANTMLVPHEVRRLAATQAYNTVVEAAQATMNKITGVSNSLAGAIAAPIDPEYVTVPDTQGQANQFLAHLPDALQPQKEDGILKTIGKAMLIGEEYVESCIGYQGQDKQQPSSSNAQASPMRATSQPYFAGRRHTPHTASALPNEEGNLLGNTRGNHSLDTESKVPQDLASKIMAETTETPGKSETLDKVISLAEKNAAVLDETKKELSSKKAPKKNEISPKILAYSAVVAEVAYHYYLIKEDDKQYKKAAKEFKKSLENAQRDFGWNLDIALYSKCSLPELQITLAQSLNNTVYITVSEAQELLSALLESSKELRNRIESASTHQNLSRDQISLIQKQQMELAKKLGRRCNQWMLRASYILNTTANFVPHAGIKAIMQGAAGIFNFLGDKKNQKHQKKMQKRQHAIQVWQSTMEGYGNQILEMQARINTYAAALSANHDFIQQNASLFSGTIICEQMAEHIQDLKKDLDDNKKYAEQLKKDKDTVIKDATLIRGKLLRSGKREEYQPALENLTSVTKQLTQAENDNKDAAKEIEKQITHAETLLEKNKHVEDIRNWFFHQGVAEENAYYGGLAIDSPERKKAEAEVQKGEENTILRQSKLQKLQANQAIYAEMFTGIGGILHSLQGCVSKENLKKLQFLEQASSAGSIAIASYVSYKQMSLSYSNFKAILGHDSILNYLTPGFKSESGRTFEGLLREFGGKNGVMQIINCFINPSISMIGNLISLTTSACGIAPPTELQTMLNAIEESTKFISQQLTNGFQHLSNGQFEIMQSINTLKTMLSDESISQRLFNSSNFYLLTSLHMNLANTVDKTLDNTELLLLTKYSEKIGTIISDVKKLTPKLTSSYYPLIGYSGLIENYPLSMPAKDDYKYGLEMLLAQLKAACKESKTYLDEPLRTSTSESLLRAREYDIYSNHLLSYLKIEKIAILPSPKAYLAIAKSTYSMLKRVQSLHPEISSSFSQQRELAKIHDTGISLYWYLNRIRENSDWLSKIQDKTHKIYKGIQQLISDPGRSMPEMSNQQIISRLHLATLKKTMMTEMIGSHKYIWQDIFHSNSLREMAGLNPDFYDRILYPFFYQEAIRRFIRKSSNGYSLCDFLEDKAVRVTMVNKSYNDNHLAIIMKSDSKDDKNIDIQYWSSDGPTAAISRLKTTRSIVKTAFLIQKKPYGALSEYLHNSGSMCPITGLYTVISQESVEPNDNFNYEYTISSHAFVANLPLLRKPVKCQHELDHKNYNSRLSARIDEYFEILTKIQTGIEYEGYANAKIIMSNLETGLPLLFPEKYLDRLKNNVDIRELYSIYEQGFIQDIVINYSFLPGQNKNDPYQLILHYLVTDNHEKSQEVIRIVVATFDYATVNSFKKFDLKGDCSDINLNEFLLLATIGTGGDKFFPANDTRDLTDSGVIAPVERSFVGLFYLLENLDKVFTYRCELYDQNNWKNMRNYIIRKPESVPSAYLYDFLGSDLTSIKTNHYERVINQAQKDTFSHLSKVVGSTTYKEKHKELHQLFEDALIGLQLGFDINLILAKSLLANIGIYKPNLLKVEDEEGLNLLRDIINNFIDEPTESMDALQPFLRTRSPIMDNLCIILTNFKELGIEPIPLQDAKDESHRKTSSFKKISKQFTKEAANPSTPLSKNPAALYAVSAATLAQDQKHATFKRAKK